MRNNDNPVIESPGELLQAADAGALILTPNKRLASAILDMLESLRANDLQAGEEQAWLTPAVIPFDAWVSNLWVQQMLAGAVPARTILSPQQDLWYWEQVIAASPYASTLLSIGAAATLAQSTYQLVRDWRLDLQQSTRPDIVPAEALTGDSRRLEFASLPDSEAFLHWYDNYQQLLHDSELLSFADARLLLLNSFLHNDSTNPAVHSSQVIMAGFHSPTPLQLALVQAFAGDFAGVSAEETGRAVCTFDMRVHTESVQVAVYDNTEQELLAAARWASDIAKAQPDASIAVVVQNLAQCRSLAERSFLKVFEPEAFAVGRSASAGNFNLSAGVPLASTAPARAAMALLRLLSANLSRQEGIDLLSSPYIGDTNNDMPFRLRLLDYLFESGLQVIDVHQLSRLAAWQGVKNASEQPLQVSLSNQAAAVLRIKRAKKGSADRVPSAWSEFFQAVLQDFGWPGTRVPNSDEYQQIASIRLALEQFAALDLVCGEVDLNLAVRELGKLLAATVYHRETPSRPGQVVVQVLGGLEAAGLQFDYLRLLGMSDRKWPASPNANPLLPLSLQIELDMPNASVERELQYASRLTEGYLHAARHVVISYPASEDDVACQLSPLLQRCLGTIDAPVNINAGTETVAELQANTFVLESIDDSQGPAYPGTKLPGGAGSLAQQAQCPFRGFARIRLGLESLPSTQQGLTPLERGNIVHAALEHIWRNLGGSAALADCSEGQVDALLNESVEHGLAQGLRRRFEPANSQLLELEKQRLYQLLAEWLEQERQRPDFVVHALEENIETSIAGLDLSMRLDRIDRLASDSYLLIDYKTGSTATTGLYDERVTQPQLPVYALALAAGGNASVNAEAVAFARLKPGDTGFGGLAKQATGFGSFQIPGDSKRIGFASWEDLAKHWQQSIEELGEEIATGFAAVAPMPQVCRTCDMHTVCRVHTADTGFAPDEDGEEQP